MCIGLNINVVDMVKNVGTISLIPLYLLGQLLDILATVFMAYIGFELFTR